MRFYDQHSFSLEGILSSPSEYLESITASDIMNEAKSKLNTDNYVRVVLRPRDEEQ